MRIQLVSDLHLEFAPLNIMNAGGTDVLILSGDICVAQYFRRGPASPKRTIADEWREFFENCANEFPYVIYVLGNHEHYSGRFDDSVETLRMALCDLPNIYILDQSHVDIGDVRFFGSTLWTDFNNGMWSAKLAVKGALNDYHCILPFPLSENDIYSKGYLDVEAVYQELGWKVKYTGPDYTESFDAYYDFKG